MKLKGNTRENMKIKRKCECNRNRPRNRSKATKESERKGKYEIVKRMRENTLQRER